MPSALIRWQVARASGRLSPATKRAAKRLAQREVSIHFRKCFWRERNRKNVRMWFLFSSPRTVALLRGQALGLAGPPQPPRTAFKYLTVGFGRCAGPPGPAPRKVI